MSTKTREKRKAKVKRTETPAEQGINAAQRLLRQIIGQADPESVRKRR